MINQIVPTEISKKLFKIGLSRDINKESFSCNLNALVSFESIEKLSKLALWSSTNLWLLWSWYNNILKVKQIGNSIFGLVYHQFPICLTLRMLLIPS